MSKKAEELCASEHRYGHVQFPSVVRCEKRAGHRKPSHRATAFRKRGGTKTIKWKDGQ